MLPEGEFLKSIARRFHVLAGNVFSVLAEIGGEYRPERIRGRHLDRLAADLDIPARGVRRRIGEVTESVMASVESARRCLPEEWRAAPIIDGIEAEVGEATEAVRQAAAESG